MSVVSASGFHGVHRRRYLLIVSLVVILLFSSLLFVNVFMMDSGSAASCMDEVELRNVINNVPVGEFATIAIGKDIVLTDSALFIPANKNITLTSNKAAGFYKIIGVDRCATIIIEDGGILNLDGVVVTHAVGDSGWGVQVDAGGRLVLFSGEISGNKQAIFSSCSGVRINTGGVFVMFGGVISDNGAFYGGGVYNNGVFELFGGVISGNTALHNGGGVYNEVYCEFTMSGGKISNNTAEAPGGGVYNRGTFTMTNGVISNNTAILGGGVLNNSGEFNRSGGEFFSNKPDDVYNFK